MAALTLAQLDRFGELWIAAGSGIERVWRPGLPEQQARELVAQHPPLHLPEELLIWWGWHNGAHGGLLSMGRFYYSLEDALNLYEVRIRSGATEPFLLPITDEWPAILVECHPDRPVTGRVFLQHFAEWPTLRLESVGELVDLWIGFFETGAWFYNAENRPDNDETLAPPTVHEFL